MKTLKHTVTLALAIAALTTHASAMLITYSYIGNDFTFAPSGQPPGFTTNDNITASFTVSGPLAPSMTFDLTSIGATMTMISNGPFTFPFQVGGSVTTDASGNIVEWSLAKTETLSDGSLLTLKTDNGTAAGFEDLAVEFFLDNSTNFARVANDPGMWSSGPATVPDQASTLALLCLALAMLLGFKYAAHKSGPQSC